MCGLQAQAKAAAEAEARKRVEEEARRAALGAPLPPGGIKRVSGATRADPGLASSPSLCQQHLERLRRPA